MVLLVCVCDISDLLPSAHRAPTLTLTLTYLLPSAHRAPTRLLELSPVAAYLVEGTCGHQGGSAVCVCVCVCE